MDDGLILAAAELRRRDEEGFQMFLGAFRAYTNKTKDDLVKSPTEQLPVMQGRARNCVEILRVLEDCTALADKREKKK